MAGPSPPAPAPATDRSSSGRVNYSMLAKRRSWKMEMKTLDSIDVFGLTFLHLPGCQIHAFYQIFKKAYILTSLLASLYELETKFGS